MLTNLMFVKLLVFNICSTACNMLVCEYKTNNQYNKCANKHSKHCVRDSK